MPQGRGCPQPAPQPCPLAGTLLPGQALAGKALPCWGDPTDPCPPGAPQPHCALAVSFKVKKNKQVPDKTFSSKHFCHKINSNDE